MSADLSVTTDEVLGWRRCWPDAMIRGAMVGRERWTAVDFVEAYNPARYNYNYLLWLILRPELIPKPILRELACQFAEDALAAVRAVGIDPDPRSIAGIATLRRWLRGEATDEEVREVERAAWRVALGEAVWQEDRAAWAAARAAAWALAAIDDVAVAAAEAAWVVAEVTAWAMAERRPKWAVFAEARRACQARQLERIRNVLDAATLTSK